MDFNFDSIDLLKEKWNIAQPFNHVVIDNFLPEEIAQKVAKEFPNFDSDYWYEYSNPLEVKKACSDWNKFSPSLYQVFFNLLSTEVAKKLSYITNTSLVPDIGLHGGGLHCHKAGGKLNTHLDYSLHPKINLQRKVNIIIYISEDWQTSWDGALGLWSHDHETNQPKELIQKIDCVFNRAVIFDTTMNSWHGLPSPVKCPENRSRNSLAVYYLCDPPSDIDTRGKALYAPSEEQKSDSSIYDLIKKRASLDEYSKVYKVKE